MAEKPRETSSDRKKSDTIEKVEHKNIFAALSAFQGELEPIEQTGVVDYKTKAGERVNFTYTPLAKITEVIYPLLAKHGLSFRHELLDFMQEMGTVKANKKAVECIVTHESYEKQSIEDAEREIYEPRNTVGGHTDAGMKKEVIKHFESTENNTIRSGKLDINASGDMKDTGAQITYARRYTLGLVLGLATEEDKDAQLLEEASANAEGFAFRQAKQSIEKVKPEDLDKQLKFLNSELYVAEILEKGEMPADGVEVEDMNGNKIKRRVPALGLKADNYRALIKVAEDKKGGVVKKPE